MEEENRKPWENIGDAPEEQWRERKGEPPRGETAESPRKPEETKKHGQDYPKQDYSKRGEKRDFHKDKHDGHKNNYRKNHNSFKTRGDKTEYRFTGRNRHNNFGHLDSDSFRNNRSDQDNRDSEQNPNRNTDSSETRHFQNSRPWNGTERRFSQGEHSGHRNRGDYGRSRASESKRGQGSKRGIQLDIPVTVTWEQLDKDVWRRLSPLPKETAELVARHLVMSGELVDENPELAYEHAKAALKMAWRIDVVREAVALTAYGCGKYAEALREIRTVRRMSDVNVLVAVEADCERGLGKPEKALEIISNTDKNELDQGQQVELAIVESAARADMGEHETGLAIIEKALQNIDPEKQNFEYARLLSVKAQRLRKLGQELEASETEAQIPREVEETEIVDLVAEAEAEENANPTTMKGTNVPLASQFPVILSDLDGVVWKGDAPTNGAQEGIETARKLGAKLYFLTNNATRPPQAVVDKLGKYGIKAGEDEVVTSAQDGANTLTKLIEPGDKVLCVGGPGVAAAVKAEGFEPVYTARENPAAVMQGLGFEVGWSELSEACYAVARGAKWVATNMDMALPTEYGRGIGNGAFVQAVKCASKGEPIACGKPEESIYKLAIKRATDYLRSLPEVAAQVEAFEAAAKAKREEALKNKAAQQDPDELLVKPTEEEIAAEKALDQKMAEKREQRVFKHHAVAIGDQLATDILGANSAGIASCVVLTGLTQPRDLVLAPQNQRPDFVALDLSDITRPFDRPELRHHGWWYCADTRARVNGENIEVHGLGVLEKDDTELSLAEFRAVLAAAWYAREQGTHVRCPDFKVVRRIDRAETLDETLDEAHSASVESETQQTGSVENSEEL